MGLTPAWCIVRLRGREILTRSHQLSTDASFSRTGSRQLYVSPSVRSLATRSLVPRRASVGEWLEALVPHAVSCNVLPRVACSGRTSDQGTSAGARSVSASTSTDAWMSAMQWMVECGMRCRSSVMDGGWNAARSVQLYVGVLQSAITTSQCPCNVLTL